MVNDGRIHVNTKPTEADLAGKNFLYDKFG